MDLGNIVYVIAIIGYFIYQVTRKKGAQEMGEEPAENPTPRAKPSSFEELMREIRDAQRPAPAPAPQPMQPATPAPKAKKRVQTKVEPVNDDEIRYYDDTYESKNKNPYQASRDTHSVLTIPEIKIDYESLKPKTVNPYGALLKNPKTLKEAMVVSEILKPKYF